MIIKGYGFSVQKSVEKKGWEVEVTNPRSKGRYFRLIPTLGRLALFVLVTYPVRFGFALFNRPWPLNWQLY